MVSFIVSAITIGIVFLLGCVGEILTEKAGHLNLGIPGIMCMGAAGGCLGVSLANNVNGVLTIGLGLIFAIFFAIMGGLIYCLLTVSFRCNQNVTGLALTIFGNGFANFFLNNVVLAKEGVSSLISAAGQNIFLAYLPFADKLGGFGKIVFGHGFIVYLAIGIGIVSAIILKKTRIGLNLRAVGENPSTADSAGINVVLYKYIFVLIGSAIAGIGGFAYVMQYMAGIIGSTVTSTIEGIGWLCIALVIFTLWKPDLAILGSIIFGALYIIPNYTTLFLPNASFTFAQLKLFPIIPYFVTILVLIFTSIKGKKENQSPASLGLSYFREDR